MRKKELLEIERKLKSLSKQMIKDRNFLRLDIRVPVLRKFERGLSLKTIETWDYIWNHTKYFEAMSLALYHYQRLPVNKKEFLVLKKWVKRCYCWEHSDDLSKIFSRIVEEKPDWILPTLKKWNKSDNLWERRQSVVSLVEYSRFRKKIMPYEELISFVDELLFDDEYYVQKGIGWTLREIYNVYPNNTLAYLRSHIGEISPIAYSAATEKLDIDTKRKMNMKRRLLRKTERQ